MLFAAPLAAAPFGFSVNSDAPLGDRLYVVDLANGSLEQRGPVLAGGIPRTDIEGLALDAAGSLWAVDEDSMKLFIINPATGAADPGREIAISGLSAPGNDFGLTFDCSGQLFVSSVRSQTLYRLGLDGSTTEVGAPGSLGANISALAAWGEPAVLYGLSNGSLGNGQRDTRSLYRIDASTGQASLVGPLGIEVSDYNEAGLSFDEVGQLWAITDRRNVNGVDAGSEIVRIDTETGAGTVTASTSIFGFESLAVASPDGCEDIRQPGHGPGSALAIPTLQRPASVIAILLLALTGLLVLQRRN